MGCPSEDADGMTGVTATDILLAFGGRNPLNVGAPSRGLA